MVLVHLGNRRSVPSTQSTPSIHTQTTHALEILDDLGVLSLAKGVQHLAAALRGIKKDARNEDSGSDSELISWPAETSEGTGFTHMQIMMIDIFAVLKAKSGRGFRA